MNNLQRKRRTSPHGKGLVMAANSRLGSRQIDSGALSQSAKQVIGNLRVIDGARNRLKTEQAHGLLVQLIHGSAAKVTGRLKNSGRGKAKRRCLLEPFEQQRESHGRR